jgi:DNA-binding NarL/FixJ family response regulator
MLRVGIVSGCPVYLIGLTHALQDSGITVRAQPTSPDLPRFMVVDAVLVDAELFAPRSDLAPIAAAAAHAPVLVVNGETPATAPDYRRAGARGVVGRGESAEGIVTALRAVAAGGEPRPAAARDTAPAAPAPPDQAGLSDREHQVLHHIARGFTHGQIATRLGISPHTVDTYVKRVRAKLGVGNKAELTKVALLAQSPADVPAPRPPAPGS